MKYKDYNRIVSVLRSIKFGPDTFFVFPSEIVTAFYQQDFIRLRNINSIIGEQFLSWDRFKEHIIVKEYKRVPSNQMVRSIFVAGLLQKWKQGQYRCNVLINQAYDETTQFTSYISRLLPSVNGFLQECDLVTQNNDGKIDVGLIQDLRYIQKEYSDFLKENNLYEPLWEEKKIRLDRHTYYIFLPEIIDDFDEYKAFLQPYSNIIYIHQEETRLSKLNWYPNAKDEFVDVFSRIEFLLRKGTHPEDIVISVAPLERVRDRIEREASRRSIPLIIRQGKPLSDFPIARLFRLLLICGQSHYGFNDVSVLFRDPAFPWKDDEKLKALVIFGREHGCLRDKIGQERRQDQWEHELKKHGQDGLYRLFKRFRVAVDELIRCATFDELRRKIQFFIHTFLDTASLGPENLKVLQTCLDTLHELYQLGPIFKNWTLPSPLGLWLSFMDERQYVPIVAGCGISVFPYKVAAGICPHYHFIINLSQDNCAIANHKYSFLREDQRQALGTVEKIFTDDFLSVYSVSGQKVFFSGSMESWERTEMPPAYFLHVNQLLPVDDAPGIRFQDTGGPYGKETAYWARSQSRLDIAYPLQIEGLERFVLCNAVQKQIDYSRQNITDPAIRQSVLDRLVVESSASGPNAQGGAEIERESRETLGLTPTMVDAFMMCPFAFLLRYVLAIEIPEYEVARVDAGTMGTLYHRVLEEISRVEVLEKEQTGIPGNENKDASFARADIDVEKNNDQAKTILIQCVEKVLRSWTNTNFDLFPLLRETIAAKIFFYLSQYLELSPSRATPLLGGTEKTLRAYVSSDDLELRGRIDKIEQLEGGYYIIDYKTKAPSNKKDIKDEDGNIVSYQIPAYIFLAEQNKIHVERASYYAIENVKYIELFGRGKKAIWSIDEKKDIIEKLLETLSVIKKNITTGSFCVPSPEVGCSPCEYRALCRLKFAIR